MPPSELQRPVASAPVGKDRGMQVVGAETLTKRLVVVADDSLIVAAMAL